MENVLATPTLQVYKRRWLILGLFFTSIFITNVQWIQFSVIANVAVRYYDVTFEAINWTSMVFFVMFMVLVIPASYFLERFGLRKSVILALFLNCIGTLVKVFAINPNHFWMVIFGQCFVAASSTFLLCAPSTVAAEWFSLNQIATACGVGFVGYQFAAAIGFIIPTFTVTSEELDLQAFEDNMYTLVLSIAIFSAILFIICIICFENKPPKPPTHRKAENVELLSFQTSVFNLLKNRSYILVLLACGIDLGILGTVGTLLNQVLANYKDNVSAEAGRIGLVIFLAATIGPIVCGMFLDKFNKHRLTLWGLQLCGLFSIFTFTYILNQHVVIVYMVSALLGFFLGALQLICFEIAIELTYPEPESTSIGLITAAFQLTSVGFTYLYSWLLYEFSDIWANTSMSLFCLIGFISVLCIRFKYNRRTALDK